MSPQNPDGGLEEEEAVVEPHASFEFGRRLVNAPAGEEVVIAGLSGQFPESSDVHQFRDNLFNKVDMVTADCRRWDVSHTEIPQRTGKLLNIGQFDAGFFGLHPRQANACDPMLRMFLEATVEAMFDAGLHPTDLEGSNTGVFIGSCFSETEKAWFMDKLIPHTYAVTGCQRSMLANRVSYFLKLKGPSFICDTACSSSLYAFEHAYKALRTGQCDRAIVGGTNVCLHPFVSLQFARLGVLSPDGSCKVFDKNCNGYARSEAITALLLQKAKDSKRIYATVLHAKTNCDGYKDSGITYPSGEMQTKLLREFYQECDKVKPSDLSFLEAHGTGTKVGDPEELQAIEEIFLPGRKVPLMIGSVKSNIGHTEPASGLCSITKMVIAVESGFIPPNINFTEARSGSKGLDQGMLKVVVEKTPFADTRGLIGINSFGFGGSNCHILLRHNPKAKRSHGRLGPPRLVCVSGRSQEAVNCLLDDAAAHADPEHIALLHHGFRRDVPGHSYRGSALLSKSGEIHRSCSKTADKTPTLMMAFGDMAFLGWDAGFEEIPVVAQSIQRLQQNLPPGSREVEELLRSSTHAKDQIVCNFCMQVILSDLLQAAGLVPDRVFAVNKGLSLGVLALAHWEGAITLKEALQCVVAISSSCLAGDLPEIAHYVCQDAATAADLQQALTRVLVTPRRLGKRVIFAATPSELSPNYLMTSWGDTRVLVDASKALQRTDVVYELGNGQVVGGSGLFEHKSFISSGNGVNDFLISLGRLYQLGLHPQPQNLCPQVEFPVSRATPMIAPKIKWNHQDNWFVTVYRADDNMQVEERSFLVLHKDPAYGFIKGHVIDGRNLFPATGYLKVAWEALSHIYGRMGTDTRIVFENVKFKRACTMPHENNKLELTVMIQRVSGNFEVIENGMSVVSGVARLVFKDQHMPDVPFSQGVCREEAPLMSTRDVYKELRLRGYNYKGKFQSVKSCDVGAHTARVSWDGNWITFMDNMLQLKILQEDTRLLYVPTSIKRIYIDAQKHLRCVKETGQENPDLPVFLSKSTGIVRCGGIEITGLLASSIARRKYLATPVLEKYVFVPNACRLRMAEAIRADMQILLENLYGFNVKAVELIDEATVEGIVPLGETVHDVLADLPLIQPEIIILSKNEMEVRNVKVEDKKLLTELDCSLVVASKLFQRSSILQIALGSIKENGFILSREPLDFDVSAVTNQSLSIVTVFTTDLEQLVFFRRKTEFKAPKTVKVQMENDKDFSWLAKLQGAVAQDGNVLVCAQNEPLSGLLGLTACIRREPGGQNIRLLFLPDPAPEFDINLPFYRDQLEKNLAMNVWKEGQWGTYRHLLLQQGRLAEVRHCYLNTLVRGDLSSLAWIEGPIGAGRLADPDETLVYIYYASLNFRDVMVASGRINIDHITRDRREQECVQGFEFSGRTRSGRRVCGLHRNGACGSLLEADTFLIYDIPDSWSLEEAATVPVVYGTAYYGLIQRAQMRGNSTILVHSGTGGVGQAAIQLALGMGCTVYTTVGTAEKREFLKKLFPQLTDGRIFSSRDINFEKSVMAATKGRGVDCVLNSLAEEKLLASVRCLARGGRFVEIGKFDLASDNELQLLLLSKEASFHGLTLDALFHCVPADKRELCQFLANGIKSGIIRPLNRTIFQMDQAEEAFRYMASGKHTGKVLIQIRKEESELMAVPSAVPFLAHPRYFCDSDRSYIICGGLGGFGLELADWLCLRGCRRLILTSRTGLKTGYQAYRISMWKSYGCAVEVSTEDITTPAGCLGLIKAAQRLGPVHAIFNLAVVLSDCILANQTEESFRVSFAPKACATKYLDEVSRKLCPELKDFVIFSSVSCGRGNAGQSNYGMSNSVMERICERRRSDGLPALAIEWGAIADVGLVAEMQNDSIEMEIGGTLQQRISNCLQVMDVFLRQKEAAIVSSMVVAEKKGGWGGADNIVDAVANILGIKDLKSIPHQATLAEAGMDSMTAVEIKQTLEREFEVFLTAADIKGMTFAKLAEIQAERDADSSTAVKKERALMGMEMFMWYVGEAPSTADPLVRVQAGPAAPQGGATVVLFPGIEGIVQTLQPLYQNLQAEILGLQYPYDERADSIPALAAMYLPLIEERISKSQPFTFLCYSYGGLIALELVALLEQKGYLGTLVMIDSSPDYLKGVAKTVELEVDDKFQVTLLVHLMSMKVSYDLIAKHLVNAPFAPGSAPKCSSSQPQEALLKLNTFEERIGMCQQIVGKTNEKSQKYHREFALSIYTRAKAIVKWEPDFQLKSQVALLKPSLANVEMADEDYGLSQHCEKPVQVRVFEGNHATILENANVVDMVRECFGLSSMEEGPGKGDLLITVDKVPTNAANKV
ncbi:hypothetical protein HUJ04_001145 [Dendroctonus ponderosae]|nr:hypothetical protein HUJ04_001145 [Dendroctonus ponderosae]